MIVYPKELGFYSSGLFIIHENILFTLLKGLILKDIQKKRYLKEILKNVE